MVLPIQSAAPPLHASGISYAPDVGYDDECPGRARIV